MGIYFNPENSSFRQAIRSKVYVDKTMLLKELNEALFTEGKCIALSHARRFGKSQAAGMIDAYYSKGSDSRQIFEKFKISHVEGWDENLNKYNVIHLDISSVADFHKEDLVDETIRRIYREMAAEYPDVDYSQAINVVIADICRLSGQPFVIIIDEWDYVIRNHADRQDLVHRYLQFLHSIFKSEESKAFLALAYITGILPIKKINDESALNNFREYTMVSSKRLTEFFGFTEKEVETLCNEYGMDFESVKQWYDGYVIDGQHMYNPNSVYRAITEQSIEAYWKNTSSFETINDLITLNFEGLKDSILAILKGEHILVDVRRFKNDLTTISSKDDAITALIHLGYLAYDSDFAEAYMPNYEVAEAFQLAIETGQWTEIAKTLSNCDKLLNATIRQQADKVAEWIELAHETYTSILKYNDENTLACAITMAYFTAPAYYNVVREMPAGKGFADIVLIPRACAERRPAIIIELKYDKSADTAIQQIKEKRYAGCLKDYDKEILLVGISYDKDGNTSKKHHCIIERINLCK